jgi:hypothetical protein
MEVLRFSRRRVWRWLLKRRAYCNWLHNEISQETLIFRIHYIQICYIFRLFNITVLTADLIYHLTKREDDSELKVCKDLKGGGHSVLQAHLLLWNVGQWHPEGSHLQTRRRGNLTRFTVMYCPAMLLNKLIDYGKFQLGQEVTRTRYERRNSQILLPRGWWSIRSDTTRAAVQQEAGVIFAVQFRVSRFFEIP